MASVIVTFNIMPEGVEINLQELEKEVKEKIIDFAGPDFKEDSDIKIEIVDVAFGLKALDIKAIFDESRGGTEELENNITEIEGVKSVEVTDVRRIIG